MRLFSPSEFLIKALEAFKRFPFVLLWVLFWATMLVVIAQKDVDLIFDEHLNLTLTAILGVSWLIGAQFYIEQFKRKGLWWIKIVIILLLVGTYYSLPSENIPGYQADNTPYIRWTIFLIVGHLTLLFAPFITVWHPKAYWNYLGNMLIAIARSALFSGVFYLGLVLAMLAIQYLFDINIDGARYFQLFIICLGIVNTWVYLSDFPENIPLTIHLHFNKAIEVFVKFILIPLAGLYIIILYAYAIKICIQWELPKGWVSYLIIALAALLFLIQFIIHPVRITQESRVFRKFQPLAYYLLLPLLVLFYVAIYKRISDYGITEARYFLIVIAIFITGATLYLIFSRKQQLRYLPIALAIFGLLGSFGFWGAFSVSTRSQLHEFDVLYSAFAKAEKGSKPDDSSYDRFSSITKYLAKKDAYTALEGIIGYDAKNAFPDVSAWQLSNKLLDTLGLEMRDIDNGNSDLHFNYRADGAVPVSGYDWSTTFYFNTGDNNTYIEEGYRLKLSPTGQFVLVEKESKTVLSIPTRMFIEQLPPSNSSSDMYEREKLTLTGSNEEIGVKIFFQSLNLRRDTGVLVINYANGIVLLNTKE